MIEKAKRACLKGQKEEENILCNENLLKIWKRERLKKQLLKNELASWVMHRSGVTLYQNFRYFFYLF